MLVIMEAVAEEKANSAFGLSQLMQGIAMLLGTPVAGFLYDSSGSYDTAFYIAGSGIIFSAFRVLYVCYMGGQDRVLYVC